MMNSCKKCGDENAIVFFTDGSYCLKCSGLKFKEVDFDPDVEPICSWLKPIDDNGKEVTGNYDVNYINLSQEEYNKVFKFKVINPEDKSKEDTSNSNKLLPEAIDKAFNSYLNKFTEDKPKEDMSESNKP